MQWTTWINSSVRHSLCYSFRVNIFLRFELDCQLLTFLWHDLDDQLYVVTVRKIFFLPKKSFFKVDLNFLGPSFVLHFIFFASSICSVVHYISGAPLRSLVLQRASHLPCQRFAFEMASEKTCGSLSKHSIVLWVAPSASKGLSNAPIPSIFFRIFFKTLIFHKGLSCYRH